MLDHVIPQIVVITFDKYNCHSKLYRQFVNVYFIFFCFIVILIHSKEYFSETRSSSERNSLLSFFLSIYQSVHIETATTVRPEWNDFGFLLRPRETKITFPVVRPNMAQKIPSCMSKKVSWQVMPLEVTRMMLTCPLSGALVRADTFIFLFDACT